MKVLISYETCPPYITFPETSSQNIPPTIMIAISQQLRLLGSSSWHPGARDDKTPEMVWGFSRSLSNRPRTCHSAVFWPGSQ